MPNPVALNTELPVITESDALWARAHGLIPAGTQTLAKGPQQYVKGVAPKYLRRGRGARVWDVDGNEFLDMNMAIGPLSLGYAYPAVDEAIRRQLEDGITFSLMHPLEVEVAELIRDLIPCAEMVRFSKTGADVTSAAVRVSRAFTGRDRVVCCGYHGWHDWYISVTDRNKGIPQAIQDLSWTTDYNNFEMLEQAIDETIACVILEPMVFDHPKPGYLEALQARCRQVGALLVFDEMWTGFRMDVGGAQRVFGVTPDLATFSKAVANGMPISILAGRADVMRLYEKDLFWFTTFGGEALSLAAAKATITELVEKRVPARIAEQGRKIRDGYNRIAAEAGIGAWSRCYGMDARTIVAFDATAGNPLELKSFVQQELIRRGVLWSGTHAVSFSHTDADVAHLLAAYEEALPLLAEAVRNGTVRQELRGEPVEAVFRRTSNFNLKPRTA